MSNLGGWWAIYKSIGIIQYMERLNISIWCQVVKHWSNKWNLFRRCQFSTSLYKDNVFWYWDFLSYHHICHFLIHLPIVSVTFNLGNCLSIRSRKLLVIPDNHTSYHQIMVLQTHSSFHALWLGPIQPRNLFCTSDVIVGLYPQSTLHILWRCLCPLSHHSSFKNR